MKIPDSIYDKLPDSVRQLLRPSWHRARAYRRFVASLLFIAAIATAIFGRMEETELVVTVVRDIPPGTELSATDLEQATVPAGLFPPNTVRNVEDAAERITVSAVSKGEALSNTDLLSSDHTMNGLDGDDTDRVLVPIRLVDPSLLNYIHRGDTVTIVDGVNAQAQILAESATVVLSRKAGEGKSDSTHSDTGTLLVSIPGTEASVVASASTQAPLSIIIRGHRSVSAVRHI